MAQVKIKSPNSKNPDCTCRNTHKNDIFATRIITLPDGYLVITSTDTELDKILNNTTDKELEIKSFTPVIPPHLRADRSFTMFIVDSHIYRNEEIKGRNYEQKPVDR